MPKNLTMIHTVPGLVGLFTELCREIMPQVTIYNLVEESLLKNLLEIGEITPYTESPSGTDDTLGEGRRGRCGVGHLLLYRTLCPPGPTSMRGAGPAHR